MYYQYPQRASVGDCEGLWRNRLRDRTSGTDTSDFICVCDRLSKLRAPVFRVVAVSDP